jgi:hypothetical protein
MTAVGQSRFARDRRVGCFNTINEHRTTAPLLGTITTRGARRLTHRSQVVAGELRIVVTYAGRDFGRSHKASTTEASFIGLLVTQKESLIGFALDRLGWAAGQLQNAPVSPLMPLRSLQGGLVRSSVLSGARGTPLL